MYIIENIVRSAFKNEGESRLNILIINEGCDKYIERLSILDHNFYLIDNLYNYKQWSQKTIPSNVTYVGRMEDLGIRYIDVIITFNRANSYNKAIDLSKMWHIPLIMVDSSSSMLKVPVPFFAQVNITNPETMISNNGNATIGVTEEITESWNSNLQRLSLTIPTPPEIINNMPKNKILIDHELPEEYIKSLPLTIIGNPLFTIDPLEANIYLHLWKNVTPLMVDCMASEIPVVTMQSPDFVKIINSEACVLIPELINVGSPEFLSHIQNFSNLEHIISNAKNYVSENTSSNFKTLWNGVLNHTTNNSYIKGS